MLQAAWQTYDNCAERLLGDEREIRFRARIVGDRLEIRRLSGSTSRHAYRTYRRVNVLREILELGAAQTGHRHGSETTAVLGSLVDSVFGEDPQGRSERILIALESAFRRQGLSADTLGLEETGSFVGEFLFGVGVACAQAASQSDRGAFSSCVDEALPMLAQAHVEALAREIEEARSE